MAGISAGSSLPEVADVWIPSGVMIGVFVYTVVTAWRTEPGTFERRRAIRASAATAAIVALWFVVANALGW